MEGESVGRAPAQDASDNLHSLTHSRSRSLTAGRASGEVIVLDEPLSFWGGFDSATGRITDRHHPQVGTSLAGMVLVMPSGRGSSSSSSVLAEAIRARTAPVAIVLREADLIVALGALVAAELYEHHVPVIVIAPEDYAALQTGQTVEVVAEEAQARIVLAKAETP